MFLDVEQFVLYQIGNARVLRYPFPHFFVHPVFPEDYYARLMQELPPDSIYRPIDETATVHRIGEGAQAQRQPVYPDRFIVDLATVEEDEEQRQGDFWRGMSHWLTGEAFRDLVMEKFGPDIAERFGGPVQRLVTDTDARLVRDRTNYSISPHTDTPRKLVSLLFYLPRDDSMRHLGTSIYAPVDRSFRCEGTRHHSFDLFKKVSSMPFLPNSLFGFLKTNRSFHGVDVIADRGVERNSLLYNIYVRKVVLAGKQKSSAWSWPWKRREQAA